MGRPEVFDDLEDHEQRDNEFLGVRMEYITQDLAVGSAVLALIDACRKSETFTVSEDGEFKVYLPKTKEERDRAVRAAQQSWDFRKKAYEGLAVCEKQIETWWRYQIDSWAKGEGLPEPDWDAHDARFEVTK